MRSTALLLLALLSCGCVSSPTLDELRHDALLSGDWSEVEKREKIQARRQARAAPKCGPGRVAYCESGFAEKRCTCASRAAIRALVTRR